MTSPLKLDPSRTSGAVLRYMRELRRRMATIAKAVSHYVRNTMTDAVLVQNAYAFEINPVKVEAFQAWLKSQLDAGLLEIDPFSGETWAATFIRPVYEQAARRAYESVNVTQSILSPFSFTESAASFAAGAFTSSNRASRLELLYSRNFTLLKDISAEVDTKLSQILVEGMSTGKNPFVVADEMVRQIELISQKRADLIARTEIVRAHAEGALDSFELLAIEEVTAEVEFDTAGDNLVCPLCASLQGKRFTVAAARGVIPIHPNCRCTWLPVLNRDKKNAR